MQKKNEKYVLSAGDLIGYLNCKHSSYLDTEVANNRLKAPEFNDPHLKVMQERGFEHERTYIEYLQKRDGLNVATAEVENGDAFEKTQELMLEGHDIITQAVLRLDGWYGRADILLKVNRPSALGTYSYEVMDTKLSRETKAGSILQLCLYSEMLERVQESAPENMYVVTPGEEESDAPFKELSYRVGEYQSYYRLVRDKLLSALGNTSTYPEPVGHCDVCRWWKMCSDRRRKDDHLSLIAGINSGQRKDLEAIGINTMEALAKADSTFTEKLPKGVNLKSLELVKEQARVQVEARENSQLIYELLEVEDGRGLTRLPEPNVGDIFFDIEGDTFVGNAGMEYLLGFTYLDNSNLKYEGIWALNPRKEKAAFVEFMQMVMKRWEDFPEMHIYHYAPYEPGAVKRLAQRYGAFENEVDRLLRAGKFIDLYGVVRQGVRASVEKYSIKDLEPFFGYERQIGLDEMIPHKRALEHNLELDRFDDITEQMKKAVMAYNQDDTDSTYYLREWLEKLRREAIEKGAQILRPEPQDGEAIEEINERDQKLIDLKEQLTKDIDFEKTLSAEEAARVLLSDLVAFYRREDKVNFWEKFRLKDMNSAELAEDKSGIDGLRLIHSEPSKSGRGGNSDTYSFPPQEVDFRSRDEIHECDGGKIGTLEEYDPYKRTITIKKTAKTNDVHPRAIFRFSRVPSDKLEESSIRVCEEVIENGLRGSKFKAVKEILQRKVPDTGVSIKMRDKSNILDHAYRVVDSMNNTYLPIQGPPGAGKSFTGSRLIKHLLDQGKKVGVSAVSHKVIAGLLTSTAKLVEGKYPIIHKTDGKTPDCLYEETKDNNKCEAAAQGNDPVLVGGTSWLFARPGMEETLDYLFIDEGGQLSLANVVSIGGCAKNIIVLGDCQQLEQPIQASHPDGAEKSALEHIQGESSTIPENMGLFLPITYRLHPEICAFNSELFYEGRLKATDGNESQIIEGQCGLAPLMRLNVEHSGNTNYSPEEVEAVKALIEKLLANEHTYTLFDNGKGRNVTEQLKEKDIMVMAPYNAQVQRLKDALPDGIEVGTVDKFQGREAPVVIYSVTTSSPEEAPRGMDFLYSGNRLNVAVSRAQCSFVKVCNERIFEPACKSPAQMKLANSYCRFWEISKPLRL